MKFIQFSWRKFEVELHTPRKIRNLYTQQLFSHHFSVKINEQHMYFDLDWVVNVSNSSVVFYISFKLQAPFSKYQLI